MPITAPHCTTVGEVTLTTYSDGGLDIPAEYFPNTQVDGPQRFGADLWLVATGGRQVLVDTGSGQALKARFAETGLVQDGLPGNGIDPAAITDIVITHMHADHIGGLVDADGALVFPATNIHVAASEWGFWTDPELASKMPEEMGPMIGLVQSIASAVADQVPP